MTSVHRFKEVAWCTWRGSLDDEVTTSAASVAFFVLLATFPGLAAVVSLVGLFADPSRVDALLAAVAQVLPESTTEVLARQITRFTDSVRTENPRALSVTPYIGFALLLWSTNRGTKALFRALNSIYDQDEKRGFLSFTIICLCFTFGALAFLVFAVGLVIVLPMTLAMLGLADMQTRAFDLLRWLVLFVVVASVIAVIYRYGPSGRPEGGGWSSIVTGSAVAALLWLGGSILFSWYFVAFGGFTELYGSLSAVIGFLVWIWLSIIAVLVGAELDAVTAQSQRHEGQPCQGGATAE